MPKLDTKLAANVEQIGQSILLRGHKVLLDSTLAELYGVATKVLVQAVKRNIERFPADFMLQLSAEEWRHLRSQDVTSNPLAPGAAIRLRLHGTRRRYAFLRTQ